MTDCNGKDLTPGMRVRILAGMFVGSGGVVVAPTPDGRLEVELDRRPSDHFGAAGVFPATELVLERDWKPYAKNRP